MVLSIMFESEVSQECDKNLIEVVGRAISLLGRELSNYEMTGSEYTLKIRSSKIGLLDMNKVDELYNLEYQQTKEYLKSNNIY